jgi:hypothetical protein
MERNAAIRIILAMLPVFSLKRFPRRSKRAERNGGKRFDEGSADTFY